MRSAGNIKNYRIVAGDGFTRDQGYSTGTGAFTSIQAFFPVGLLEITDEMREQGFTLSLDAARPNFAFNAASVQMYSGDDINTDFISSATTGVTLSGDLRTIVVPASAIPATALYCGTNAKWLQGIPSLIYSSSNVIPDGGTPDSILAELENNLMVTLGVESACLTDVNQFNTLPSIETPTDVKQSEFIVCVNGYGAYIRRKWDSNYDLSSRVAYSPESPDYNNVNQFLSEILIDADTPAAKTPGAFAANYSGTADNEFSVAIQSDNHPAIQAQGMFQGGVHGVVSSLCTAVGHGKTNVNRGATLTINGKTRIATAIRNADKFLLTAPATGTHTNWAIESALVTPGTTSAWSDGSGAVTISAVHSGVVYILPATRIIAQSRKIDGETAVNGSYIAKKFVEEVDYGIPNPSDLLDAIVDDLGSSDEFDYNSADIETQIRIRLRWTHDPLSTGVYHRVTAVQDFYCNQAWPIQFQALNHRTSQGQTHHVLVPGTLPTGSGEAHDGGDEFDFTDWVNSAGMVGEYYFDASNTQPGSFWADGIARPALISAEEVRDSSGNPIKRHITARSYTKGRTATAQLDQSLFKSIPHKTYTTVINDTQFAAGDEIESYAGFGYQSLLLDPKADINFAYYIDDESYEWTWWCNQAVTDYEVPMPSTIAVMFKTLVCRTAGCELSIDANNRVTVTTTAQGQGFVITASSDITLAITPPKAEENPYPAHTPSDIEDLPEFLSEQQRIIREQHNLIQAGDTTFSWGQLLESHSEQLYTLGSLGRFYHEDYGMIHARYVQYESMLEPDIYGYPVGLLYDNLDSKWQVTSDLDESRKDLIVGICCCVEAPEDDSYGWVIVSGPVPVLMAAESTAVPNAFQSYSWTSSLRIGFGEPNRIVGFKFGDSESSSLPAGSFFVEPIFKSDEYYDALIAAGIAQLTDDLALLDDSLISQQASVLSLSSAVSSLQTFVTSINTTLTAITDLHGRQISTVQRDIVELNQQDVDTALQALRVELEAARNAAVAILQTAIKNLEMRVTNVETITTPINLSELFARIEALDAAVRFFSEANIAADLTGWAEGNVLIASIYTSIDGLETPLFLPGALDATSIGFTSSGSLTSTNVSDALDEIQGNLETHEAAADPHTQYALLLGRAAGQVFIGGTASGNNLTLRSTSHATKGKIIFGAAGATVYDEVNERIGVNRSSPSFTLDVGGKIGIDGGQVLYRPDQTNFTGTLVIGSGGASLSHSSGAQGFYNLLAGISAGFALTTGTQDTLVGYAAGYSATSAAGNTVIGFYAHFANQTGGNNVIIGANAGRTATSGNLNVAIGVNALYSGTAPANNMALGANALFGMGGVSNVGIGYNSGRYQSDGTTALASGNYNMYLGSGTYSGGTVPYYEIVIGTGAAVKGNGSYTVTIGDSTNTNSTWLHGSIRLEAGASGAGNLAITEQTDTDTGLYWSAANELTIQTGGQDLVKFTANAIEAQKPIRLKGYTVATLPGSPTVGMQAYVTDANAPAIGSTVAGGGASNAMVWYNGSNWTVTGI